MLFGIFCNRASTAAVEARYLLRGNLAQVGSAIEAAHFLTGPCLQ